MIVTTQKSKISAVVTYLLEYTEYTKGNGERKYFHMTAVRIRRDDEQTSRFANG